MDFALQLTVDGTGMSAVVGLIIPVLILGWRPLFEVNGWSLRQ